MPNETHVICDGSILSVAWIMHNDKAWLVPEWILSDDGKQMQPVRIISLALASGNNIKLGEAPLQFFHNNPITSALLERGIPPPKMEKVFDVVERPSIWLPNPAFSH